MRQRADIGVFFWSLWKFTTPGRRAELSSEEKSFFLRALCFNSPALADRGGRTRACEEQSPKGATGNEEHQWGSSWRACFDRNALIVFFFRVVFRASERGWVGRSTRFPWLSLRDSLFPTSYTPHSSSAASLASFFAVCCFRGIHIVIVAVVTSRGKKGRKEKSSLRLTPLRPLPPRPLPPRQLPSPPSPAPARPRPSASSFPTLPAWEQCPS